MTYETVFLCIAALVAGALIARYIPEGAFSDDWLTFRTFEHFFIAFALTLVLGLLLSQPPANALMIAMCACIGFSVAAGPRSAAVFVAQLLGAWAAAFLLAWGWL